MTKRERFTFKSVSPNETKDQLQLTWEQQRTWRNDQSCAIQARQSTTKQKVENRESSEAQTKDQLDRVHQLGWKDDLIIVFIEGEGKRGVSGRLRIDERPGLSALLEGVYNDTIKTIFTWNESRLFRDEFMIGPDTFIKACYDHDVIVVTRSYRYDFRRNPYDMDQFRMQCQIAARFIKDQIGYMHDMRDRVGRRGQFYAGSVAIGYILDRQKFLENGLPNPNYNRFIVYEPHAYIIRWLFKRFKELGGSVFQLGKELDTMPYVFPPYEAGVKAPFNKLKVKNGGYCIGGYSALIYMLTNVTYIGYWKYKNQVLRDQDGHPIINHPPIVDEEDFWYAFKRLSPVTIDGEINDAHEAVVRYDQEGKIPSVALLKMDGILKNPKGPVYCVKMHDNDTGRYKENYAIQTFGDNAFQKRYSTHVDASLLDAKVVEKMFEYITAWQMEIEGSNVGATIYERFQEEEAIKEEPPSTQAIDKQLAIIQPKITHLDRLVRGGYELDDDTLREYGKDLAGLRKTQKELEKRKEEIQTRQNEKAESRDLLDHVLEKWNEYNIKKKRRVIRLVVDHVIISRETPNWLKVEIIWKSPELPTADIGYLWLPGSSNSYWQPEEKQVLREIYPYSKADEILEKLPNRAWHAIIAYARRNKIKRHVRSEQYSPSDPAANFLSVNDRAFMMQHSIEAESTRRGSIVWTDSDTFLPLLEEDLVDIDDIMTSDNGEDHS